MSFPEKETNDVGGLTCKQKNFKRKLWVYKDIGGKLIIKGTKKERESKGTHVYLSNYYFLKDSNIPGGSAQFIQYVGNPGVTETTNKRRTTHKQYAVGLGVKLKGKGPSPTLGPSLDLPFAGVLTQSQVTVDGKTHIFITKKGSIPEHFAPPLAGFRAKSFSVLKILKDWLGLTPSISLLKDVFASDNFKSLPKISLKQQLFQLEPKPHTAQLEQKFPEDQFNYQHAYFLMGFSNLAHTIKKDTKINTDINFRGSLHAKLSEHNLDKFHLSRIKHINKSNIGKLVSDSNYILAKNGQGDILVAFQGLKFASHNRLKKINLSEELGSGMINYKPIPISQGKENKLHEKIYSIYQTFEKDLDMTLKKILKKQKPHSTHIYFTGHGFGGALATLAALDFVVKRDDLKFSEYQFTPASLYTFGSPRVLSKNIFKNLYRDRLISSYNVVSEKDLMPILPFVIEPNQFVHGGQIIILDDKIMKNPSSLASHSHELKTLNMLEINNMNFEKQFIDKKFGRMPKKIFAIDKIFSLNNRQNYYTQLRRLRYVLDFGDDLNDKREEEDD
ncbi:lipase family protein [Nitrosopumilus sp.]|uniref:lipase family protein n=1 Tax=Nitrosopumilus sp. TaxID=2024843 RepID=UPI0029311735|nr:hypothetical protein [Nitrosopumilus sp.]